MKSKGRKEIEQMIVRGHAVGMCDSDGNSTTLPDGRFVAKARRVGVVKFHKVYGTKNKQNRPRFKDYRE